MAKRMEKSRGTSGQRDQMRNAIIGFFVVIAVLWLLSVLFRGSSASILTTHNSFDAMSTQGAAQPSGDGLDVYVPPSANTTPTPFELQSVGGAECGAEVIGCMDKSAANYNSRASRDSGQCERVKPGCTNSAALSANPNANTSYPGACWFAQPKSGCTDPNALNYSPDSVVDDGTCVPRIFGCTNPYSAEYDPAANTSDGKCAPFMIGCTNPAAKNYDPMASVDGGCWFPKAGCTNPAAGNFSLGSAVQTAGSCCVGGSCGGLAGTRPLSGGNAPCSDCS